MITYISLLMVSFIFLMLELKNKKIKYISLIPVLFMAIIFMTNKTNFDYSNYKRYYENSLTNIGQLELGFFYFMKLIKKIGFGYQIVPTIIAVLLTYVFFLGNNKNNDNSIIVFLYSIYFFILDVNQIRNLLMIILVYVALKYKDDKKYFFLNFLATFFHRLGFIYLLFGFIRKIELKKYIKIITILYLIGLIGIPIVKIVSLKIFPGKLSYYFLKPPNYGFLIFYIMIAIDLVVVYFSGGFKRNTENQDMYLKFFLFSIIFLPYSTLSMDIMQRVYRNAFLVKTIFITQKLAKKEMKDKLILFLIMIFNSLLPLVADYRSAADFVVKLLESV